MTVSEFCKKNKIKNKDKNILIRLHGEKDSTEQEWFNILKPDIDFDHSIFLNNTEKVNKKLEKIKNLKEHNNKEK